MGLALLTHASMPLKYWDEAFLAMTYLINPTPTKILAYDTPLHKLQGAALNYSSFHVFGYACWSNLRSYNSHKLQLCFTHCVFFGYSNMHKSFKCLDISTGHIYISCDIIFDESVFPFESLHSIAGVRYHSDILLSPPDSGDDVFTDSVKVFTFPIVSANYPCVQLQLGSNAGTVLDAVLDDPQPPLSP
jgi:hypothetical protein